MSAKPRRRCATWVLPSQRAWCRWCRRPCRRAGGAPAWCDGCEERICSACFNDPKAPKSCAGCTTPVDAKPHGLVGENRQLPAMGP